MYYSCFLLTWWVTYCFVKKCLENDFKSPTQSINKQDLLFKKCTRVTTYATCGTGTANLSEHPSSPPDFGGVRVARFLLNFPKVMIL